MFAIFGILNQHGSTMGGTSGSSPYAEASEAVCA